MEETKGKKSVTECYNCDKVIADNSKYVYIGKIYCQECKDLLFPNEKVDHWVESC